jgi:hypothetical protein
MSENFTKKQLEKLNTASKEIQPDVLRTKQLEGATENDGIFYDKMGELYKELCEKDISFNIFYLLPESKKPMNLFRITHVENRVEYTKRLNTLNGNIYAFLCWSGFFKGLDREGYIKILPKGEHMTWEDKIKFSEK